MLVLLPESCSTLRPQGELAVKIKDGSHRGAQEAVAILPAAVTSVTDTHTVEMGMKPGSRYVQPIKPWDIQFSSSVSTTSLGVLTACF